MSRAGVSFRFAGLSAPIDVASLVGFRIAFGLLMVYEVYRFFETGWIEAHYTQPPFLFPYPGFEWVRPWPGLGMSIHFGILGVFAMGIALGFCYRFCAVGFTLGFAYVFLLDQARYLNHFYLIVLLAALLAVAPVHRAYSVDAWRHRERMTERIPAFWLVLFRAQMTLVYLFAAIAKLNPDWLAGWPMRRWLVERAETSVLPEMLEWPPLAVGMGFGGLFFDLLIVPALLWRRTRIPALMLAILFHVTNAYLFRIGIFPALGIAVTTLFLDPSWPRRCVAVIRSWVTPDVASESRAASAEDRSPVARLPRPALALAIVYFAIQILVPLRHWIYPNEVRWTEQGQAFSWRMKLSDKEGRCRFWINDEKRDERWIVDPRDYLRSWQYSELCSRPEMMTTFAHHLERRLREVGADGVFSIGVDGLVSLNGRPPQPLIDPGADLLDVASGAFPNGDAFVALRHETPDLDARRFGFAAP